MQSLKLLEIPINRTSQLSPQCTKIATYDNQRVFVCSVQSLTLINECYAFDMVWIDEQLLLIYHNESCRLQVWNADTNTIEYTFKEEPVSWDPPNKKFIFQNGMIGDVYNSTCLIPLPIKKVETSTCFWSSNGNLIAIKIDEHHIQIFNALSGKFVQAITLQTNIFQFRHIQGDVIVFNDIYFGLLEDAPFPLLNLRYFPNLNIYEVATGKLISKNELRTASIWIYPCLGNSSLIIILDNDIIKVWDIEKQKVLVEIKHFGSSYLSYNDNYRLSFKWCNNLLLAVRKKSSSSEMLHYSKILIYNFYPEPICIMKIKETHNGAFDSRISQDGHKILIHTSDEIKTFLYNQEEIKELLTKKISLKQTLLLLSIEKKYKEHELFELDDESELIVSQFYPNMRGQLEQFLVETKPTIIQNILQFCKFIMNKLQ